MKMRECDIFNLGDDNDKFYVGFKCMGESNMSR